MVFLPETPGFTGHETFPMRYAWLKKGVDAVSIMPDIFNREDALLELGVGKNMVRSIRHWCLTTGVLRETGSRTAELAVTPFGSYLFGSGNRDPYLEDEGTLWLLHWRVASNARRATTWYWAFNFLNQPEFRKDEIVRRLTEVSLQQGWARVAERSLRRDVDCFIRTYVPGRVMRSSILEDSLDCPLVELDLIQELPDHRTYRFTRGNKPSLPIEVFTFCLLEYWRSEAPKALTLSLEDIAHRPGSPGRIFQLDDNSLAERLAGLYDLTNGLYTYQESTGIKQVLRTAEAIEPESILDQYYGNPEDK